MRPQADVIGLTILCAAAAAFIWLVSFAWGGGLPLRAYVIPVAISGIILAPLILWRRKRIKYAIYGAFVLSIAVLAAFPWTPRDHFVRRLYAVRPGMTLAQADSMMHPYLKWRYVDTEGGFVRSRHAAQTVRYRHSDSADYGADIGSIGFRDGRVVSVTFSPD